MNPKNIFFSLVLLLSLFLSAQEDNSALIQLIQEEQRGLDIIEGEIQYFYNLINLRKEVREQYKNGNLLKIERAFDEDSRVIDNMFRTSDAQAISMKVGELKVIYSDVPELKDQILFYRAKSLKIRGNVDKSQNLLEELVDNYQSSPKFDPALFLLEEIYFIKELDSELITLYNKFPSNKSGQQKYQLAQAYYNIDDFDNAKKRFQLLSENEEYSFRAKSMLALIAYFEDGINASIKMFETLKNEHQPSTPYYDFVILSLARLYSEKKDMITSLDYYEQYLDLQGDLLFSDSDYGIATVELQKKMNYDEIMYEIGTQYKNAKDYDRALYYYSLIINNPVKSEYFASAKFAVLMVELEKGDINTVEEKLNEIISVNNILLETLNAKYSLLEKYKNLRTDYSKDDISENERTSIKNKMDSIESALQKTNTSLQSLYKGLDPVTLIALEMLEEEYLSYNSIISEMEAVIKLANTIPNKKIPKMLDKRIEDSDAYLVTLQMISYLGHLQNFTTQDYELARALAVEKLHEDFLLNTWKEIRNIARETNHPNIAVMCDNSIEILSGNLESIDTIARIQFQGEPSADMKQLIREEAVAIEQNRDDLIEIKQEVIEKFNKKIAKRLDKEKELLVEENEMLKETYHNALTMMKDDIVEENDRYQISLLDVLFKQSQTIDEEYKEFTEQMKNE
ncbi:MAG TPA: hypothetical protein ENL20_00970 [Candidatus Cloacimonetes bacterium]|nr:hypothetical protein [Candidatus Cloacimonadota bacterium]